MAELQQRQGVAIIVVLAALAAGWWWQYSRPAAVPPALPPDTGITAAAATPDTTVTVTVIFEGEVVRPGRYAVPRGTLLGEAVQQAGGLTAAARAAEPDPYLVLMSDTRIYVPPRLDADRYAAGAVLTDRDLLHVGRTASSPVAGAVAVAAGSAAPPLVNLNTATREELMTLPRIGPKTAEAIIAYRDRVGTIRSLDELRNVPRLGEKTLAQLRERVTF